MQQVVESEEGSCAWSSRGTECVSKLGIPERTRAQAPAIALLNGRTGPGGRSMRVDVEACGWRQGQTWLGDTGAYAAGAHCGAALALEPNANPAARTFQEAMFDRLKARKVAFTREPTRMGPVMMAVFADTAAI